MNIRQTISDLARSPRSPAWTLSLLVALAMASGCSDEPANDPATVVSSVAATNESTPAPASTTPPVTPPPIASGTTAPRPASTPRPGTPSPPATPTTLFEYGNLVPPDDKALIEAGINIARRYLDAAVGIDAPRVTVYAYVDLQNLDAPWETIASQSGIPPDALIQGLNVFVGETFPEAIFINVASPRWKDLPTLERIRLAAHEYVHAIQLDLMGAGKTRRFFNSVGQPETTAGPLWLVEGSAEYLSWLAVQSTGLLSLDRYLATTTADHIDPRGLASFGAFQLEGPDGYMSALRTTMFLAGESGEQRIVDYFDAMGKGDSWEVAFRQTFGRNIDTFYRDYDAVDGR